VHNIIIAEEGAELHVISGCASASYTKTGSHIGVTEFYVGRGAHVTSTMIHNWGEQISVFPRSATRVEEDGVFISNYVCMQPVRKVQMAPFVELAGRNAIGRFSSIVVCISGVFHGSWLCRTAGCRGGERRTHYAGDHDGRNDHLEGDDRGSII